MRHVVAVCLLLIAFAFFPVGMPAESQEQPGSPDTDTKPNIVLITADDMRYDDMQFMPKTRRAFESAGATRDFTRAYVSLASCCPSRATTLTGQYPHNHGALTNDPEQNGGRQAFRASGAESRTVAVALQDAGYETALFGKYLNGYEGGEEAPDGPSNAEGTVETDAGRTAEIPPGWDRWFAFIGQGEGMELADQNRVVDMPDGPYDATVFDEAERFVARPDRDTPFFAMIGAHAPHAPHVYPDEYEALYPGRQVPAFGTASYNERDMSDKRGWVRYQAPLRDWEIRGMNVQYRERARSLAYLDERVSGLVSELREAGELENTRLVFTSDNGYHLGEHRLRSGKTAPYEEDIRVPLLVGGSPLNGAGSPRSGIEEGKEPRLALNNDLAPTMAGWGGASLEVEPDGRSLSPLLKGDENAEWRKMFLVEKLGGAPKSLFNYRAVRVGPRGLLYVRYMNGGRELYDLQRDGRQVNSYFDRSGPAVRNLIQGRLNRLATCEAEGCVRAENGP